MTAGILPNPTASLTEDCKNTLNSDIIEASTHGICCFTDGSKTEHGTGGGFVISDTRSETITEHSFKRKDYCTVFRAGTAVIKHAAEELIAFNNQQITFWSGSLSALKALSNKIYNTKSITDCHKALTILADEITVQLKWTKAHTGHWAMKRQTNLPNLIQGNHHTKTLKILTNNLNNRTRYRTGICIITGHIGLNKNLRRINRSDTPNCPNCTDTEETVAHYIGQCPAYSLIRGDTLSTYYDSINDIMDNNNIDLIITLHLQLKDCLRKRTRMTQE